jgi:Uma2 family endonuclease
MDAALQNFNERKLKREMIDGQIYLMASACDEHVDVQSNLSSIFNRYFEQNKRKCRARINSQIYLDEKNYLEPDVKILCRETRNDDIPVIAVEVLSKSTEHRDYGIKMNLYAKIGIKEYWLVNWKNFTVAIYLLKNGSYEHCKTYARYIPGDRELKDLDETEKAKIEITTEFSPVSFPELCMPMEKVFDIFV